MKILLIGGTGVLSTDVAKAAIDSGCELSILNRGSRRSEYVPQENCILADIRNVEQTRATIGDRFFDVVIDFLSFNVAQLISTMQIFNGRCKQYVFISSATAYARDFQGQITEDVPLTNHLWEYASAKAHCEEYLRKHACDCGFEYTIVRPYITYGKTRIPYPVNSRINPWTLMERIQNDKPVVMWNDGNAMCTLTHTKDFSRAIVGLCMNPKAYGEAFHITSGDARSWNDVLKLYCDMLGKTPDIVYIGAAKIEAFFPELKHELTGDKGTSFIFNHSKLQVASDGFDFNVSFEDGIRDTFDYYSKNAKMNVPDYGWDAQLDALIQKETKRKYHYVRYGDNGGISARMSYVLSRTDFTRGFHKAIKKYIRILRYRLQKKKRLNAKH